MMSLDPVRTDDILQLGDRTQRDHLARGIARLQQAHLSGGRAERGIGLRHHVPRATEIVEIVDVKSAEVNLQRLENVGDRDVLLLVFDAVPGYVNLRDASAEGGEQPAQLGATAGGIDQVLSRRLELLGRGGAGTSLYLPL